MMAFVFNTGFVFHSVAKVLHASCASLARVASIIGLAEARELNRNCFMSKTLCFMAKVVKVPSVLSVDFNSGARKACFNIGRLEPFQSSCNTQTTMVTPSANKRLVWNRFALHTAGRYAVK